MIQRARRNGIAFAGIRNSAHVGVLGIHLLPVAQAGLVGFAFTNSPAAIPPWGGKKALFGTNPVAAAFPRKGKDPLVIDLAMTTVVRGRIMMAMRKGERIPEGWALDADGKPTTDPKEAIERGSLFPDRRREGRDARAHVRADLRRAHRRGDRHRGRLVLRRGRQPPRIGQAFIAIDPSALAGMEKFSNGWKPSSARCSPTPKCACPARAASPRPPPPGRASKCPTSSSQQIEKLCTT